MESNSIFRQKGAQGGKDEATKTAHLVRLGAEDAANAVIVSNANWNNLAQRLS